MPITWGREILMKLKAAGIVPSTCRRVIIDISEREVAKVIYDCYGDEKLMDIDFGELLGTVTARNFNHKDAPCSKSTQATSATRES